MIKNNFDGVDDQRLNSTCPPYLNDLLSWQKSLTWKPTDVWAMSLNNRAGNLNKTETLHNELNLTFVVSLLLA